MAGSDGAVPVSKGIGRRLRRAGDRALGTLVRVRSREPVAALTFDDGPDPRATPRYLEVLAQHNARATFFMLGEEASRHPDVVREVHDAGHAIGNHSWDHPRMPELTGRERRSQIRRCASALAPFESRFFRPPYTLQSPASFWTARSMGYEVVAWGVQVEDWLDRSPEWIRRRLLDGIRPGAIVLLHDAVRGGRGEDRAHDRGAALQALDDTLARLSGKMRFVTVPELMKFGEPVRRPWFVRSDDDW